MKSPPAPRLQTFGFLVKDVSRLSTRNFERHARALGLSLAECKMLAHLARHEGISQIRLAEITDTAPMTLVRILDRMEKDGWIERRAHPSDRRARCLHLTSRAAPLLEKIWAVAARARAEALEGLSAAERERLMALLERVHHNLVAATSPAEPKPATRRKAAA